MIRLRALYFILGAAFALTISAALFLWDSFNNFGYETMLMKRVSDTYQPREPEIQDKDLLGTWIGRDSYGYTYTITRRGDGTFTETAFTSPQGEVSSRASETINGRWAFRDSHYACYEAESIDYSKPARGPWLTKIIFDAPNVLRYSFDEGCWNREVKK